MSDADELARKERRRRRLIERLVDEKERLIGPQSPSPRGRKSEEELAA